MVLQRLRDRLRKSSSPEPKFDQRERALNRKAAKLEDRHQQLQSQAKEYKRLFRMEQRLHKKHDTLKLDSARLSKRQKEWEHKERAHQAWKTEHAQVMAQLNERAESIEFKEESLRAERQRLTQQQRLLQQHEKRLNAHNKILNDTLQLWREKMDTSGFTRMSQGERLQSQNWVHDLAVAFTKEEKNHAEDVEFIE